MITGFLVFVVVILGSNLSQHTHLSALCTHVGGLRRTFGSAQHHGSQGPIRAHAGVFSNSSLGNSEACYQPVPGPWPSGFVGGDPHPQWPGDRLSLLLFFPLKLGSWGGGRGSGGGGQQAAPVSFRASPAQTFGRDCSPIVWGSKRTHQAASSAEEMMLNESGEEKTPEWTRSGASRALPGECNTSHQLALCHCLPATSENGAASSQV